MCIRDSLSPWLLTRRRLGEQVVRRADHQAHGDCEIEKGSVYGVYHRDALLVIRPETIELLVWFWVQYTP